MRLSTSAHAMSKPNFRIALEILVVSNILVHCTAFPTAFTFSGTGLDRFIRTFGPRRNAFLRMSADGAIASEVRAESSAQKRRFYFPDGDSRPAGPSDQPTKAFQRPGHLLGSAIERLQRFLFATFLPVGFPNSVPPEYVRFQLWNVLQDLSSNLRGIMSTQKLLEGMGVGKAGVTSLAATLQWVARDGSAMIGGLIFTAIASANFGRNVKRWRMFADLVNDVALTIDMIAPAFPPLFLPLICLSSVLKAMCGISAGACNNAIMQHWALRGNIADVGAKSGAQHTLVSLCALPLGMAFTAYVNTSATLLWQSFLALTALHIYANYAMLKSLALRTLGPSQLDRLLPPLLGLPPTPPAPTVDTPAAAVSPVELARSDPIFWLPRPFSTPAPFLFDFGVSLAALSPADAPLPLLVRAFQGERFILADLPSSDRLRRPRIACVLAEGAAPEDHLRAYVTAHLLLASARDRAARPRTSSARGPGADAGRGAGGGEEWAAAARAALGKMEREVARVRGELGAAGWDLQSVSLGDAGWVARW